MLSRSPYAAYFQDQQAQADQRKKAEERKRNLFKVLHIIPISNALYAALQLMLGAKSLNWSRFGIISIAFITLISNMGIGRKFTLGGMADIQALMQGDELPPDFLPLTRRQLIACLLLTFVLAGYTIFEDVLMTFFYGKELPYDLGFANSTAPELSFNYLHDYNSTAIPFPDRLQDHSQTSNGLLAFCIALAILQGLGDICGLGVATHKSLAEMASDKPVPYIHTPSKIISNVFGIGFGVPYSAGVALSSIYLIDKFNVINIEGMIAIAAISSFIAYSVYALNGRYIRDSVNDFFVYIEKQRYKNQFPPLKHILPFLASNGLAYVTANASKGLTELFLEDIVFRFNISTQEQASSAILFLSYVTAAGQDLITLASLHPIAHSTSEMFIKYAPLIRDKIREKWFARRPATEATPFIADFEEEDIAEEDTTLAAPARRNRGLLMAESMADAAFGFDDSSVATNSSTLFGKSAAMTLPDTLSNDELEVDRLGFVAA